MNAEPQLDMLVRTVLTPQIQAELGIAPRTVRIDGHYLRFRLDPDNLFERHGRLRDYLDGSYGVSISQRYRPHEDLIGVTGRSGSIVDLAGELRAAVRFARDRDAHLPHWRETLRRQTPQWSLDFPVHDTTAIGKALVMAPARARETGCTHFVSTTPGQVTCANNPTVDRRFFSVTPAGDWAVHWGTHTYPLSSAPMTTALDPEDTGNPAQVAGSDPPLGAASVPVSAQAPTRVPQGHPAPRPGRRTTTRGR